MGYAQHVGRVGALAVALGIGVAVANGGVANATTDPDADPGAAQGDGQDPGTPPVDNPGTDNPETPQGPENPGVVINGVEQNDNPVAAVHRRVTPRVMILDVLRGGNLLGARRSADHNPPPTKPDAGENEQPEVVQDEGGTAVKLAAPTGSDPVTPVASPPRFIQRTIAAITAPPAKPKITPTAKVLSVPTVNQAAALDVVTTQIQRQAATITAPVALVEPLPPLPPPRPSPVRFVLNLLTRIGLSPAAFPPGSPLAPVGQLLELVYAGLRRIDHQAFNQAPQQSVTVGEPADKTGVITGRVAYDYDDDLEFEMVEGEGPQYGTVAFNPDGTFTYTPNYADPIPVGAKDSFTVRVTEATTDHLHPPGEAHELTVNVGDFDVKPNLTVVGTVPTGPDATWAVVTPDGTRAYIAVGGRDHVVVYDIEANQLVGDANTTDDDGNMLDDEPLTIAVGDAPSRMITNSTGTRIYVLNEDDTVSIINSAPGTAGYNTVIGSVDLDTPGGPSIGPGAQNLAISPDDSKIYVTAFFDQTVSVIRTSDNTLVGTFQLADGAGGVENNLNYIEFHPDPARNLTYIGDVSGKEILVVDTTSNTVVDRIAVPGLGTPQGMAVNADGTRLYVANNGGTLDVIDIGDPSSATYNTVIETIDVFDPEVLLGGNDVTVRGNRIYLTDSAGSAITVVDADSNTVIEHIPVGKGPYSVAASPDGTLLFVPRVDYQIGDGSPNDDFKIVAVLVPATVV